MITEAFYDEHNLTRGRFAKLIGVSDRILKFREEGHRGYDENDIRIELGVQIVEHYKMWWPPVKCASKFWMNEVRSYDRYFKRIFDRLIKIEL